MKKLFGTIMMMALLLTFAACGGSGNATNAANGNAPHNEAGHTHNHGDAHDGEKHDLGDREKGDYKYEVVQIGDPEDGGEGIFELRVNKGDTKITDATIAVWIGDASGKELTPRAAGEWRADEDCYDLHVALPPKLPASMKLWVTVNHGGSEIIKDSFDVVIE